MSVLSHLAFRFSSHPENLASEALAYILARSTSARRGIVRLVDGLCGRTLDLERFETQAANDDQTRPDLCGFDGSGERPLLIEVKFWAGLTEAQPNGYLASMSTPGVLLFVAPAARLQSLWDELRRRVADAGASMMPLEVSGRDAAYAAAVSHHALAATSWRTLLDFLEQEAIAAAETDTAADIRQLQALCEQMDTEAFLPLASEELTSSIGRRVVQFEALANDLTDQLVGLGVADVTGLRAAAGWGYCGRYLYLRGNASFLGFSANYWAALGQSPIWLQIVGESWKRAIPSPAVKQSLALAGIRFWERDKSICVPIALPSGVERDRVVANAIKVLLAISSALPEIQRAGATPPDNGLGE